MKRQLNFIFSIRCFIKFHLKINYFAYHSMIGMEKTKPPWKSDSNEILNRKTSLKNDLTRMKLTNATEVPVRYFSMHDFFCSSSERFRTIAFFYQYGNSSKQWVSYFEHLIYLNFSLHFKHLMELLWLYSQ